MSVQTEITLSAASRPLGRRDLLKSAGLHGALLAVLLVLPADALRHSAQPKEVDVVFHPPAPRIEAPPPVRPLSPPAGEAAGLRSPRPAPTRAVPQEPRLSAGAPLAAEAPGVPVPEPVVAETPQEKAGKSGILAFKDQFASLAKETPSPQLGAAAHYGAAVDASQPSSRSYLLNSVPGGSAGINMAALSREVGGGGGGGGAGGGGMEGVAVGRATSSIASIGGGGGSRALGGGGSGDASSARGGPGPARTDEEIQIVFDRHKASFYRLYHVELRKDPTLRGQIVLRLTIEPDGHVSMCALQSSDMHAPDLAAQVVDRVREINFGAKEGVRALTIVYPIDFLPAA